MLKKTVLSTMLLFYSLNSIAQTSNVLKNSDSVTRVTYKLVMPQNRHPERPYNQQQMNIEQAINNCEFELFFTENNSTFRQIEKLGIENNDEYKFISSVFTGGVYFKDIKLEKKIKHKEDLGINVITPLDKYKWEFTTETKMISGFKCYKATCVWIEYDIRRNKQLTFNSEAWYAPEIPVSFGPINIDGLPGLVLEANLGAAFSHYYATKIEFNIKKSSNDLNIPTKGKFITEDEYQTLEFKKSNN